MGDIREIRPGVSQEPDPNPLSPSAIARLSAIDRGVNAFMFVFGMRQEDSDIVRQFTYGNFYQPRELNFDETAASHFVDLRLKTDMPFIEAVERFRATGQLLDKQERDALLSLLPLPKDDPENIEPFEPNQISRMIKRRIREISREAKREMDRVSEEYMQKVKDELSKSEEKIYPSSDEE